MRNERAPRYGRSGALKRVRWLSRPSGPSLALIPLAEADGIKLQNIQYQPEGYVSSPKISAARKELPMVEYEEPSNDIIFVKWFRHWRTGKRVYPKNAKVIAIRVKKPKLPK